MKKFLLLLIINFIVVRTQTISFISQLGNWNDTSSWDSAFIPSVISPVVIPKGICIVPFGYLAHANQVSVTSVPDGRLVVNGELVTNTILLDQTSLSVEAGNLKVKGISTVEGSEINISNGGVILASDITGYTKLDVLDTAYLILDSSLSLSSSFINIASLGNKFNLLSLSTTDLLISGASMNVEPNTTSLSTGTTTTVLNSMCTFSKFIMAADNTFTTTNSTLEFRGQIQSSGFFNLTNTNILFNASNTINQISRISLNNSFLYNSISQSYYTISTLTSYRSYIEIQNSTLVCNPPLTGSYSNFTFYSSSSNIVFDAKYSKLYSLNTVFTYNMSMVFENSTLYFELGTVYQGITLIGGTLILNRTNVYDSISCSSRCTVTGIDSTMDGTSLKPINSSLNFSKSRINITDDLIILNSVIELYGSNISANSITISVNSFFNINTGNPKPSFISSAYGILNNGYIQGQGKFTDLENNGTIIISPMIEILGSYKESSIHTDTIYYITNINQPIFLISGQGTFMGGVTCYFDILSVNMTTLNTTDPISIPIASFGSSIGLQNNVVAKVIDENGDLLIDLNKICNLQLLKTNTLLLLEISECNLNSGGSSGSSGSSGVLSCQGTPQCGGPSQGICTNDGCHCIGSWVGPDCSSKRIVVKPPTSNTSNPSSSIDFNGELPNGETISFSSLIGLIEISELDYSNKVIQTYPLTNWLYRNQSTSENTRYLYKTSIKKPNQKISTDITVKVEWFSKSTIVKFAGESIQMNPSTLKYNFEISPYPFGKTINKLELVMSASLSLNANQEEEICSHQEFNTLPNSNSTFEYIKLQSNSVSLYGRFINRGVLDGINIGVSNRFIKPSTTKTNDALIGIIIPTYQNLAVLDPDFSVLLDSNPADTKEDSVCSSSKSKGLSKSKLAGIIIGSVLFVAVIAVTITYIKYKNRREKLFQARLRNIQQN